MTKLVDKAVEAVRHLSAADQDEIALLMLDLAGPVTDAVVQLSSAEEASFDASFAEAERGDFASDAEVRAIWSKHGL